MVMVGVHMSQPTAGSMLADLLKAQEAGASQEELIRRSDEFQIKLKRQLEIDPTVEATVAMDAGFIRAGHRPENKNCDHLHWVFDKHGRYCTCGTSMFDPGD